VFSCETVLVTVPSVKPLSKALLKNCGTVQIKGCRNFILAFVYCFQASKYLDENSRYEILELLGHLEGELQAKDIAIATLKVRIQQLLSSVNTVPVLIYRKWLDFKVSLCIFYYQ